MKAEINKNVELVQILLFLTGQHDKTFQCLNNKTYVNSITEWFAPFKDHIAVDLTRELVINENFVHIEPLCAIISLDSIIKDTNHKLHKWGAAVKQFVKDSGYDDFLSGRDRIINGYLIISVHADQMNGLILLKNIFDANPMISDL